MVQKIYLKGPGVLSKSSPKVVISKKYYWGEYSVHTWRGPRPSVKQTISYIIKDFITNTNWRG